MRGAMIALLLAVLVAAGFPAVGSQSVGPMFGAVDRCTQACDARQLNGELPKNGTEPVWVILYGHVQSMLGRSHLNTQPPDPSNEPDMRLEPRHPCVATRTGTPADLQFDNCKLVFQSSPGLVEFLEDGWRTHQEPGLAGAVPILGPSMSFYVTLSTSGAAPHIGVSARLETGRHVGRGEVIAASDPDDPRVRRHLVATPGEARDAWEIEIPMKLALSEFPEAAKRDGFTLSLRVFQAEAEAGGSTAPGWQLRTGAKFPPRLVFQTEQPLKTLDSSLSRWRDSTFVRWSFQPSFGSYDVNDSRLRLVSVGPKALPPESIEDPFVRRSVDMDGHFKPVNVTWRINHTGHRIEDGAYVLRASVPNLVGSYELEHLFRFEVRGGRPVVPDEVEFKGATSPGPGVALFLLSVVLLGMGVRNGKAFQPPRSG